MKKVSSAAFLTVAVLALLGGCGKPMRADVRCQEHTQGFLCSIDGQGGEGHTYDVCWDVVVTCGDGQRLRANTCEDVSGGGKSTAVVPNAKFTGGTCRVNKVAGIAVENVKVTRK